MENKCFLKNVLIRLCFVAQLGKILISAIYAVYLNLIMNSAVEHLYVHMAVQSLEILTNMSMLFL